MPIRLGEPTLFLTNWADCPFLQPLPHRVETLTFESCLLIISLARSHTSIIRYSLDFNRVKKIHTYLIIAYYYYYYYCLLIIYLLLEEIKNNKGSSSIIVSGARRDDGGSCYLIFLVRDVRGPACLFDI